MSDKIFKGHINGALKVSLPIEKLINELNSVPTNEREKIIDNVPWLKEKLIHIIQKDLISLETKNIFDEITQTRELLFSKYGNLPDCVDLIREDRSR